MLMFLCAKLSGNKKKEVFIRFQLCLATVMSVLSKHIRSSSTHSDSSAGDAVFKLGCASCVLWSVVVSLSRRLRCSTG